MATVKMHSSSLALEKKNQWARYREHRSSSAASNSDLEAQSNLFEISRCEDNRDGRRTTCGCLHHDVAHPSITEQACPPQMVTMT
jgi:hypothetical protein